MAAALTGLLIPNCHNQLNFTQVLTNQVDKTNRGCEHEGAQRRWIYGRFIWFGKHTTVWPLSKSGGGGGDFAEVIRSPRWPVLLSTATGGGNSRGRCTRLAASKRWFLHVEQKPAALTVLSLKNCGI